MVLSVTKVSGSGIPMCLKDYNSVLISVLTVMSFQTCMSLTDEYECIRCVLRVWKELCEEYRDFWKHNRRLALVNGCLLQRALQSVLVKISTCDRMVERHSTFWQYSISTETELMETFSAIQ